MHSGNLLKRGEKEKQIDRETKEWKDRNTNVSEKEKKEDLKHKYEFEMEGIKKNDRHKFIREVNLEKERHEQEQKEKN